MKPPVADGAGAAAARKPQWSARAVGRAKPWLFLLGLAPFARAGSLTDEQMDRLRPFFPKSHGKPRVDDRRVLSGIIFINRNGLRWCDAPKEYGPPKTLYNRWKRWSDKGVFARMMDGLAAEAAVPKTVMIDATYLKAHRTATSLRSKKGGQTTRGAV